MATATPVSDLNPIWMTSGTTVVLNSEQRGKREIEINQDFFTGYRQTIIGKDEIIEGIWIPYSSEVKFLLEAYCREEKFQVPASLWAIFWLSDQKSLLFNGDALKILVFFFFAVSIDKRCCAGTLR